MVYNLATKAAMNTASNMPSSGSGSSLDWLNAGAEAFRGGVNALNQPKSVSTKEQKRKNRAEQLLNLLRSRLASEDETRKTQNDMANVFNDLLQNKAAQFRQSIL